MIAVNVSNAIQNTTMHSLIRPLYAACIHFEFHLLLLLLLFTSVAFVSLSFDPLFAVVTRRLRGPIHWMRSISPANNASNRITMDLSIWFSSRVPFFFVRAAHLPYMPATNSACFVLSSRFRIVRGERAVSASTCVHSIRTINARAQCALCIHRPIVCAAIQEQHFCRILCIIYIWSEFHRKRRRRPQ